ncbi:N-acetylmannosamine-6-phosphate 2-epimerase [Gracilibacillus alcaliphilus]|uniref:N-acetylmannosamine-6-phosphate 2-epimerase n=1 Tax=Gracilibacillus alcaliphilus TaxID=1401441 RepID=UPI001959EA95|nr:N-acetylmannosamine-6-phosphate 2-epimerase [Gracilibacillus alcaliphilus]MBM7677113.1 N-acylglucosamine-6-phosphate 2-epimerase [Gracilibacillus alcaliphilus]
MNVLKQLENKLIVSCQALEHEPLHSSFIMGRMAVAAVEGGAAGIRANSGVDIKEIKQQVDVPVIGLVKRDYPDSEVFITATLKEIDELIEAQPEIIALDATLRKRPNGVQTKELVDYVKDNAPTIALMADISTVEEAVEAEKIGFDCVSTTLVGYTKETEGQNIFDHDYRIWKDIHQAVNIPVVAEGKIDTPEKAAKVLELGASFVVVGSAITRPQLITKSFYQAVNQ